MLLCHMYGTTAAGDGWHDDCGFERGDASACVFRHVGRRTACSVYGDGVTSEGPGVNLDWFKVRLVER